MNEYLGPSGGFGSDEPDPHGASVQLGDTGLHLREACIRNERIVGPVTDRQADAALLDADDRRRLDEVMECATRAGGLLATAESQCVRL